MDAPQFCVADFPCAFTVTAKDQFNNTATNYSGTAHFTSSDGTAALPADTTLKNGIATLSATLHIPGAKTITATDTVNSSITGTSNPISVIIGDPTPSPTPIPGPATHFNVIAPVFVYQFNGFNFTVVALDALNHTATGYTGTIHFTTTDPQGLMPPNGTLTSGIGIFSAGLLTIGTQTITATDTVSASITGTSNDIMVASDQPPTPTPAPGPATHFEIVAPQVVDVQSGFTFTVRALDALNNTATGYTGTIHFTSTDPQGFMPADATLTNGFRSFQAGFRTQGNQTLTATDTVNSSITGSRDLLVVWCTEGTVFSENFDGVVAPALPAGWVTSFANGPLNCPPDGTCPLGTNWTTSGTNWDTYPNCAFHNDPGCVTDSNLETPAFAGGTLTFLHSYNLENGFDGGVLEVSFAGGPFTDITAAGGGFGFGGYNGTISSNSQSPIAGRPAWTGNSGGYIITQIYVPFGQNPRIRFRLATDCSGAGAGWRVDSIKVTLPKPCPTPPATPTPTPFTPTPTPPPPGHALNLSTRMRVETGDNVGIGGFIVTGTSPKQVLLRAIGPSLTGSGVPNALADPTLELHGPDPFATITNNNWRSTQEAEIIATGIPPTNDLESAILVTLSPGAYTAIIRGNGNTSGVALVEVYDLNPTAGSQLANISTRALVNTGSDIVVAGFILGSNSGSDRIVVRGIGPSLTGSAVPNVLVNPTLELRNSNGAIVIANNDWQDDPAQAAELTAAGLAPENNLESGIAATLPPGLYTALLAGLNNATGIGLVEVYDRGAP